MVRLLPGPKSIKDLFEDLLGRDVTVSTGAPLLVRDLSRTITAVYVNDGLRLVAVVGMDLKLAAFAGAALGLVPVGGAKACLEENQLTPMLSENVSKICSALVTLLNREGATQLRHYQTYMRGEIPPTDVVSQLLALGNRLDLTVAVSGYGTGRFALSLPPA